MVSAPRPSLWARIGAGAVGLSIGAVGLIGLSPMFRTPSGWVDPSETARDEQVSTSGACLSSTGGGGWRFPDVPLTSTALGCVRTPPAAPASPSSPAVAKSKRPAKPARAVARDVTDRAPVEVLPPAPSEPPSIRPAASTATPETPPKASASPTTTVPMPPVVDPPCDDKRRDDRRESRFPQILLPDEYTAKKSHRDCPDQAFSWNWNPTVGD